MLVPHVKLGEVIINYNTDFLIFISTFDMVIFIIIISETMFMFIIIIIIIIII